MQFFPTMLALAASASPAPTFYKDVLQVLQRNCRSCHRAREAAPMALTYQDAVRAEAGGKARIQARAEASGKALGLMN